MKEFYTRKELSALRDWYFAKALYYQNATNKALPEKRSDDYVTSAYMGALHMYVADVHDELLKYD